MFYCITTTVLFCLCTIIPPSNGQFDFFPFLESSEEFEITDWQKQCGWIERYPPAPKDLNLAKLQEWETCIFTNITHEYARKYADGNIKLGLSSLKRTPPKVNDLIFDVLEGKLLFIEMDEDDSTVLVEGEITFRWKDSRLMWDSSRLNLEKIRLHQNSDAYKIWYPQLGYVEHTFNAPKHIDDWKTGEGLITISSDGTIVMTSEFDYHLAYTYKYENFPFDVQKVCPHRHLENSNKPENYGWKTNDIPMKLGPKMKRTESDEGLWNTREAYFWGGKDDRELHFCVEVKRHNPVIAIEVVLPIIVAAVLAIVAPLFGGYRAQNALKILVLILMYFCLSAIIDVTYKAQMDGSVPKLVRAYEYMTVVTLINIVVSLVVWTLAKAKPSITLPYKVTRILKKFNNIFILTKFSNMDGAEMFGNDDKVQDGNFSNTNYDAENAKNATTSQPSGTNVDQQITKKTLFSETDFGIVMQWVNNILFIVFAIVYIVGLAKFCRV